MSEVDKKKQIKFKRNRRRRPCPLCVEKVDFLDYKSEDVRRFITDRGKIASRRMSGACAKHQRVIAEAVKRARQICLIPTIIQ